MFTETDVSIIEAFAIFCGLGIHNTQMYENACKLMAKQKVALECLSYHATASPEQTTKLVQDTIQPAEDYSLYSFKFIGKYRMRGQSLLHSIAGEMSRSNDLLNFCYYFQTLISTMKIRVEQPFVCFYSVIWFNNFISPMM